MSVRVARKARATVVKTRARVRGAPVKPEESIVAGGVLRRGGVDVSKVACLESTIRGRSETGFVG